MTPPPKRAGLHGRSHGIAQDKVGPAYRQALGIPQAELEALHGEPEMDKSGGGARV